MIQPRRPVETVRIVRWGPGGDVRDRDVVTTEEPLELRLAWWEAEGPATRRVSVTMRTPGDDFDLAAGFLYGEGFLSDRGDLAELTYCRGGAEPQEYNVVEARLRDGVAVDPGLFTRNFYTTSSCGVCGKASLDAVEVRGCAPVPAGTPVVGPATVADLPAALRDGQGVFERTGGLHAAGLFTPGGELVELREDVGRHNAVDKVVGASFLEGSVPLSDRVLVVSGRTSFDILQKALVAGVPVVVAVGAPSSLAVELARRFGVTLIGFARGGTFNVYAGEERIG